MKTKLVFLFLLFVSCINVSIRAQGVDADKVLYVSPAYSNTSPFYITIQDAINAATAGTLIKVYPAVYEETVTLKDGVNLDLAAGVFVRKDSYALTIPTSGSITCSIIGQGCFESTRSGTEVVRFVNTGGNNSKIYFECSELKHIDGAAVNVDFYATNVAIDIHCSRVASHIDALGSNMHYNTNVLNFSAENVTTDNASSHKSISTNRGTYNLNIKYLWGNGTVLYSRAGIIHYTGIQILNSYSTAGHCILLDSGASLSGNIDKISNACESTSYSAIALETGAILNLNVQDTIFSVARCVGGDGSSTINLVAGYIINTQGAADSYTMYVNSQGYITAKEIKNLDTAVVYWGSPGNLLTITAKFSGNVISSRGIVTIDSDNLALQDCVIYNAGPGNSIGVESGVTQKGIRIYGTLFTNTPRSPAIDYLTGAGVNDFYTK